MPAPSRGRSHPSRTPLAEWIVGGLGLLAVGAMLVVLLTEALTGDDEPPALTLVIGAPTTGAAGWILPIEVRNAGDRTAAAVEVEGASGEETAAVTLDYVPARGSARATLSFRAQPAGATLRVVGFAEP